ncbi:MAG TPA: bifunctional hydroxymethylpyrimidine kinase/phosphomethylpyrimidine kinase [Thermodesulfobacteriota bacterium]|nr:bifunctional hydroxymethylpyrimidine kinase/phosphomethylpyrimidine kinase [Thermodesulfobacteriota bacterium]
MKRVLTIAGSDSGGGAGIQADLKVITLLGGFGMSVITALTAQNTVGVQGVHEIPARFVEEQIDAVLSDIGADAVKTGMLANREIVEVVSRKIKQYNVKKVVVDPVMISKSGASLLRRDAQETLIKKLIPMAWVVTPNLMEASALAGCRVSSLGGMKKAARQIYRMGTKYVVVKGGHLKGVAVDVLYDGERFSEIEGPRIESKNTHGTGCTFASAIATFLARGDTVYEAVQKAKTFITMAIQSGFRVGKGTSPTNPSAYVLREMERYRVIQELKKAVEVLKREEIGYLIPEVSSNLGYALPFAEGVEDVAAFPGRIVRFKDSVTTYGDPEFGASQHVANIILTVMKSDPEYCSAMNIRYSRETVAQLRRKGFLVGQFNRRLEPKRVKAAEGSSLEWGVEKVLRKMKRVPDFIFDEGDVGKEPMVRVLGRNPMEVVQKILKVSSPHSTLHSRRG